MNTTVIRRSFFSAEQARDVLFDAPEGRANVHTVSERGPERVNLEGCP
jgi:hypothetical protein